jgi:hypothetical protein
MHRTDSADPHGVTLGVRGGAAVPLPRQLFADDLHGEAEQDVGGEIGGVLAELGAPDRPGDVQEGEEAGQPDEPQEGAEARAMPEAALAPGPTCRRAVQAPQAAPYPRCSASSRRW